MNIVTIVNEPKRRIALVNLVRTDGEPTLFDGEAEGSEQAA